MEFNIASAAGYRSAIGIIERLWVEDGLIYVKFRDQRGRLRVVLSDVRASLPRSTYNDVKDAVTQSSPPEYLDRYLAE